MRLRKCPICNSKAIIVHSPYKDYRGRYFIHCKCLMPHLRYTNPIDLREQWNRWVKLAKGAL